MVLISSTSEAIRFTVKDHSYVGAARRALKEFAERLGLSGEPLDKLNLLVSELATNLAKHAENGGEILAYASEHCATHRGIKIFSIDRGPGIADVEAMMVDGVSCTNTWGAGLGALKRHSDTFEISSQPGRGTVVLCTISKKNNSALSKHSKCTKEQLDIGYVSVPHPSELCDNGDTVSIARSEELTSILVVDGLGHGHDAAIAAESAAHSFQASPFAEAQSIVARIHKDIHGTRGAALALLQINHCTDKISFVGVGNISGRIYIKYANRGCVSIQGIVGSQMGNLKEYTYDWEPNAALLICTDGIKSCASIESCLPKSSNLLSGEIYRDHSRQTDDATVVVVKDNRS